jgi:uncharacterized protein YkwD
MSPLLALVIAQSAPKVELDPIAAEVIERTNRERSHQGLPILRPNGNLIRAAEYLAGDLADRRVLEHRDRNGRKLVERVESAGYTGWTAVAENIAFGQKTADDVVASWMRSPGHRKNILDSDLTEIGVGFRTSSKGQIYWVQTFGSRG